MKNLSLATKIGILVGVLVICGAVIAFVGARQMSRSEDQLEYLIDNAGRALVLASAVRVDLLGSIRAEKNAVITPDKARATEFADQARKSIAELRQRLAELTRLVGMDLSSREGKALDVFERAFDEFEQNQKEVLSLAVVKSNWDGLRILNAEMSPRVQDAEEFVTGLGETVGDGADQPADAARQAAKVAAGREMIGRAYAVLHVLGSHLISENDKHMAALDQELRARTSSFQDGLRRLTGMLTDSERARGGAVLSSLENIKTQVATIQDLSHANTVMRARELTITRTFELANRCDSAMSELTAALAERLEHQKRATEDSNAAGRTALITTGAIGLLIALVLGALIARSISRPVERGVRVFESLAAGDLTQRINLDQRDEIGRLGKSSDQMAATLCDVVTQIRSLAERLGESSGELSSVSHDLLAQSHEVATQAETVAAGTEQLTSNISSMAAAAEQMSVNVSSISSASEEVSVNVGTISASAESASRSVGQVAESVGEITASLQGVARDARQGSQMTQEAREMAVAANKAMTQLDQAASEINKVTDVIKTIAIQTNLLALNATIEATSAGEAGKGFAVVAGEIKDLANQSGQSAEEIARKIESVQACTREAVKVIDNVARSIGDINTSAGRISEAVGVQTQTAGQIASSVAQARKGVEDIARSIAEVAKGANDASGNTAEASKAATDVSRNATEAAAASQTISSNIHGVSEATRQSNASAVKVDEAARKLKEIAARLQRSVEHFKTAGPSPAADRHV